MHIIYTMSTQCTFSSHLLHIPDTFKTLQGGLGNGTELTNLSSLRPLGQQRCWNAMSQQNSIPSLTSRYLNTAIQYLATSYYHIPTSKYNNAIIYEEISTSTNFRYYWQIFYLIWLVSMSRVAFASMSCGNEIPGSNTHTFKSLKERLV